jgi:hypothetical protein
MEESSVQSLKVASYIEMFKSFSPEEQKEIYKAENIIMNGITKDTLLDLPEQMHDTARFCLWLADQDLTLDTMQTVLDKYNRIKDLCCGGFFDMWAVQRDNKLRAYLYPATDSANCTFGTINDLIPQEPVHDVATISKEEFFNRIFKRSYCRVPYLCKSIKLLNIPAYVNPDSNYVSILDVVRSPNMDKMLKDIGWLQ